MHQGLYIFSVAKYGNYRTPILLPDSTPDINMLSNNYRGGRSEEIESGTGSTDKVSFRHLSLARLRSGNTRRLVKNKRPQFVS